MLFPENNIKDLNTSIRKRKKNVIYNQYFTPFEAINYSLKLINYESFSNIIDPSVGDGNFINIAKKYWNKSNFYGIDIDENFRTEEFNFILGNSLNKEIWENNSLKQIKENGGFDLAFGNPPYSSWFDKITDKLVLQNFEIANGLTSVSIEILFIELFIRITKNNGFILIVLPDGILGNPQNKFARDYILKRSEIKHIINLPRNIFQNTSAKTSILILQKKENITDNLNYEINIHDFKNNTKFTKNKKDVINRFDFNFLIYKTNFKTVFEKKQIINFISDIKTGKTKYGKERVFEQSGIRFLHANNITNFGVNYSKYEKFISIDSKMFNQNALTNVADILFVRVGAGCAGRVAIIDSSDKIGVASDYLFIVRTTNIDPFYLTLLLNTDICQNEINKLKHGVAAISINKKELQQLEIPIIEKDYQCYFSNKYKSVLRSQNISEYYLLKEELQSFLIKGKLKYD